MGNFEHHGSLVLNIWFSKTNLRSQPMNFYSSTVHGATDDRTQQEGPDDKFHDEEHLAKDGNIHGSLPNFLWIARMRTTAKY